MTTDGDVSRRHAERERGSYFAPFRSVAFRWLWGASAAMTGAQQMERTATAWLALQSGGGAVGVGLVFAARSVPSLLFGLASGTVADRIDRRRQLLTVAGIAAALMACVGWLVGGGAPLVWQVVAISFAAGCVQVSEMPARQALVLDTVPRAVAPNAIALTAVASRSAGALGAIGIGLLIPLVGVGRCYFAIAATYAVAATLAAALRVPKSDRPAVLHPPFGQALREAARLVVDVSTVRTLIIAGIACEVFAFSYGSALPVLTRDVLAAGPEGLGLLNAAASVGGMAAVLLLSLLAGRVRREPLLGGIFVAYGACILALATAPNLTVATAVLLVTGFCAAAFDVTQQTLIQFAVPDAQRGRAVGLWILSIGSAPVGHLEMGTLIAVIGAPGALLINGSLTLVSAAMLLIRSPHYRPKRRTRPATG